MATSVAEINLLFRLRLLSYKKQVSHGHKYGIFVLLTMRELIYISVQLTVKFNSTPFRFYS